MTSSKDMKVDRHTHRLSEKGEKDHDRDREGPDGRENQVLVRQRQKVSQGRQSRVRSAANESLEFLLS